MEQPKFLITTRMEKEDYRKFLYIATFLRKKSVIPMLVTMCLLGSLCVNAGWEHITLGGFIIVFFIMLAFVMGVTCFRLERRNKQRMKTDRTGSIGAESILKFYDEYMEMETPVLHSHAELRYEQFYGVMESKDFFIFYVTMNQASLIRKKDMNAKEAVAFREFLQGVFGAKYRKM